MTSFIENLFDLKGRVAAVTGGGGYLCGEMARGLAKAGCKIVVMDLRAEKAKAVAEEICKNYDGEAIGIEIDATNKSAFKDGLNATLDVFGEADILINGAGINAPTPFLDIQLEEFHAVINSQIISTLLGCQVFGQHMLARGKGSIINISSASAGPPLSKAFAYSVAKSRYIKPHTKFRSRVGHARSCVNAIRPGFFPTEWNRKLHYQRT